MLLRRDPLRLCVALVFCLAGVSVPAQAGNPVVNFDSTVTPWDVQSFGSTPGPSGVTWIYVANGKLDEPLQGLAANQTYHLTLHTTPGEAFRLDPAAADLEVVLYTPYHNNIYDPRPILATNIGTVQLGGQNVTGSPLGVNLRDEGGFEGEVSVSAPATYARVMTDPEQQALVTDLTFDFTLPADFDPASPMGPLEFDAVALAGTETLPAGQVLPEIAGFAHVPEPLMLAPLALAGLVLLGRRPRTRQ